MSVTTESIDKLSSGYDVVLANILVLIDIDENYIRNVRIGLIYFDIVAFIRLFQPYR